jgi:hypothetical protein
MISDGKQLEQLFQEINQSLTVKVPLYIIGGAALLYQGLKVVTKDIDVIADDTASFDTIVTTLLSLEFKKKDPTGTYKKMHINAILERQDFRIDLFLKTVCKKVRLSTAMKNRAIPILTLKNLQVFLCSNEDIFLFKSMTEREGDLEDCIALVQRGIQWNIILNEIKSQIQMSGKDIWITWIGERLDHLEEKGLTIPIMKTINQLRDDYFYNLEKQLSNKIN